MSDIVNPRVENHYLHPKKYAWRADSKTFNPDQVTATPEEENISSVIKERFKMVTSSNFTIDNVSPQNGIPLAVHQRSPMQNPMSQDTPLDFSVKTVSVSQRNHGSDTDLPFPTSSMYRESKMSYNSDRSSIFSNNHSPPISAYNEKKISSSVPIYNGGSKFQRPKLRHLNGSSQNSQANIEPSSSRSSSENGQTIPLTMHEIVTGNSNSLQNSQFQNSDPRMQESNEESSFHTNGTNSSRHSPKASSESSPGKRPYAGSILHEVLAAAPGERSQSRCLNSYSQKLNNSEASPKALQGNMTSQLFGSNPVSAPNMILPDTGSMLQTGGVFLPGQNPLMPANFAFLNSLGFSPNAINGMNPFGNGSILSPTMDTRMLLTPTAGDKKQTKPVRPFKAITNELLYGIPTMGLQSTNPVMQNGGYFRDYFQAPTKEATDSPKSNPVPKRETLEVSANSAINSSPPCSSNSTDLKPDAACSGDSNCSYPEASALGNEMAEVTSNSSSNNRKRSRTLPEEFKDEAYWERRRKNNQAAKRSRDARRQKEDMVAQQAWLFREQNIQLRFQISGLEEQHQRMQIQFRAMTEQCRNLELQLRLTNDNVARNRCGKCGSRIENDITENNLCDSNKND